MEALLFIAKYGVLLCFIAVLCSASSQVRQLVLSFRHKNKFVQVLIFAWFVSLMVYGGSKPSADTDDSSQNSNQQEHSTQMPAGMVSTNINTQPQFMGGNVANTLNSTSQSQLTLPQWYIAKGYPIDDSDGDSIPDTWERWTHTKKLVNDALLDYDGDEVDNINEFMYMCDPHRRDTDGDGLDDKTEIDGMLAGIDGLNPISKANYIVTEVDSNYNGIPDLWDETSYHSFRDVNNDGFDDVYANKMPPSSQYNFDVAVTISTTRTALLSSEYGSMLIAPCTNKVVKLRLSGDVDEGSISLSAFPDGANVSGLWKTRMDISFLPRYGQDVEKNRIKLEDGYYIDFDSMESENIRYINSIQLYGRQNQSQSNKITLQYESKSIYFYVDMTGVCLEHGPNPQVSLYSTANVLPLCVSSGDETVIINDEFVDVTALFSADVIDANPLKISAYKEEQDYELRIEKGITIERSKICRPAETNIVGVAWTSTHNPIDASDHEPSINESIEYFGQNCPPATNLTVKVGFSHNLVNTRNLPIIETNDPKDSTDHCVSLIWRQNMKINLDDFIDIELKPILKNCEFTVNGDKLNNYHFFVNDDLLEHKEAYIYYIELCNKNSSHILDQLWIVVINRLTKSLFNNWVYYENKKGAWIHRLPRPKSKLNFDRENFDPEPDSEGNPSDWNPPFLSNSWLHHDSKYEMRSHYVSGGHGNQACYDELGNIVLKTIAGGTADYSYAAWWNVVLHVKDDVNPFIWALLADGNPCRVDFMNSINRPCLYQGSNLNRYLEYRPIIKPE